MAPSAIAADTAEALEIDPERFQEHVENDAAMIKNELATGTFDNHQGIVGLEYEFYAVGDRSVSARDARGSSEPDDWGALQRVPRRLLELIGFEKELGLHNAEMNTSPQPLNSHGLVAQESEVRARLRAALERTRVDGMRLVSDAIWTIPPAGESARHYLTDSIEDEGVRIATNMSDAVRYHAMANSEVSAGMRLEAPHVTLQADTVMPESLITSIQPHYQVPHAGDLPEYFNYAVRLAGPLLALGVNSPFFPPDLYDADASAREIIDDAWMEHRISVFETALNSDGARKVRFPRDLDSVDEAIDRIVDDTTFVPLRVDRGNRFDDQFAHFRLKHGSYWRWVRPVFGGASRSDANARIEFRPIPSQPTVRDSVAFQAAFAGGIECMHTQNHPVHDLDWHKTRSNFYAAMRDGLEADLEWITAEGRPTTDLETIIDDVLETAADGLRSRGLDDAAVQRYLGPLRFRGRRLITPARWKHRSVSRRLGDSDDIAEAIQGMQRDYIELQADTLIDGVFADWVTNSSRGFPSARNH